MVHQGVKLTGECHAALIDVASVPVVVNVGPSGVAHVSPLGVISLDLVTPVRLGEEVLDISGHVGDAGLDLAGAVLLVIVDCIDDKVEEGQHDCITSLDITIEPSIDEVCIHSALQKIVSLLVGVS